MKAIWILVVSLGLVGPMNATAQYMGAPPMHPEIGRASPSGGGHAGPASPVRHAVRELELAVTPDGFVPSRLSALDGETIRLVVTRTDGAHCDELEVKYFRLTAELAPGKTRHLEFTPAHAGKVETSLRLAWTDWRDHDQVISLGADSGRRFDGFSARQAVQCCECCVAKTAAARNL